MYSYLVACIIFEPIQKKCWSSTIYEVTGNFKIFNERPKVLLNQFIIWYRTILKKNEQHNWMYIETAQIVNF
jgi:hypothetical protein